MGKGRKKKIEKRRETPAKGEEKRPYCRSFLFAKWPSARRASTKEEGGKRGVPIPSPDLKGE